MNARRMVLLVAEREIRDRLANRAFLATTAVLLLVVIGTVIVPSLFTDDGPREYELGILGETPEFFEASLRQGVAAQEAELDLVVFDDRGAAVDAVDEGEVEAVVVEASSLLVNDAVSGDLQRLVDGALAQAVTLERLAAAGVSPQAAAELLGPSERLPIVTTSGNSESEREAGIGAGFFATILLFMMIQINGGMLMTGTIEEKSSRVVEVLLGTIRPWQLLAGKLIGIVSLAIGQLLLFVGTLLAANATVDAFELPATTTNAAIAGLVMFLVGFGLYAALFAVAGALATSAEDAQASAGPLGLLVVSIYMGVLLGVLPNPDGVLARVLTFLPPSAPFAVPVRVAADAIAVWEIVVAAVLTLVGMVLTVRVAGRLYSAAILAGGRLTWREVFRAEPLA